MIAPTALRLAGEGARLVQRPRGAVSHVYVGSLSPSGRGTVPRRGRAVCHSRTGVLYVVEPVPSSLDPDARRLCRRCVAALLSHADRAGGSWRGGHTAPVSREDWIRTNQLTPFDLALAAFMAETETEIQRVEYLALLQVGWPAVTTEAVVSPSGKQSSPLWSHIDRARSRLGCPRGDTEREYARAAELRDLAAKSTAARKKQVRRERVEAEQREGRYVPGFMQRV